MTKITFIEWKALIANFPPGTTRLEGRFYKLDPDSRGRKCFDLAREVMPDATGGRPSKATPGMSVAERKKQMNRKWYERDKQAKKTLLVGGVAPVRAGKGANTFVCLSCGVSYQARPSRMLTSKFCSKPCQADALRGKTIAEIKLQRSAKILR